MAASRQLPSKRKHATCFSKRCRYHPIIWKISGKYCITYGLKTYIGMASAFQYPRCQFKIPMQLPIKEHNGCLFLCLVPAIRCSTCKITKTEISGPKISPGSPKLIPLLYPAPDYRFKKDLQLYRHCSLLCMLKHVASKPGRAQSKIN